MADRRVRLILEAQVDRFNANMKQARTEADSLRGSLKQAVSSPEVQQLGRHMTAFGVATLAGLGMATKAAIDWESSWADVMRRTDGTPQQLQELEDGLRGIATELPTTHAEIANVAAAAAQLGIHVSDVEEFTRVMIDMGVSTDMTAEQAATSMARFANIMGTPTAEMRNLGSSVVDLGNNAATTESEIMDMSMRLAGAGRQAGLSEGDVLGMATAMSSLGIRSEAGGTALSRTMNTIGLEVDLGGEKLESFANVAGMTSEEFSRAWQEDAAGALIEFVGGLAGAEERGESMNGILQDLGITAEREAGTLRVLASNTDLLTDSVGRGNTAFEESTALGDEAAYVYETVAAQIQAFWSNIQDAAITIGQSFLPALQTTVEWLSEAVSFFAGLPEPVQNTAAGIGLLAGALALAAGSAILLAPGLMASHTALTSLGLSAAGTKTQLAGLGKAFGIVGVAIAAFQGIQWLNENFRDGGKNAAEMALELNKLAEDGGHASDVMADLGSSVEQTVSGVGSGTREYSELADAMGILDRATWTLSGTQRDAVESWRAAEEALTSMVQGGDIDQAVEQFSQLAESARDQGMSLEEVADKFPTYTQSLMDWADKNDVAITSAEALSWAVDGIEPAAVRAAGGVDAIQDASLEAIDPMAELDAQLEEVGLAADGVVESMSAYLDTLYESGMLTMSARDATARFHESLDAADAAVRQITESQGAMGSTLNKNKTDFDLTTEAGRLANGAFQDITRSGMDAAQAMAENGASQEDVQGKLRNTYDQLLTAAEGFGLSEGKARDLTREVLGVPDGVTVDSWMSEEAQRTAENLRAELDRSDGRVTRSSHIHSITTRTAQVSSGVIMNQSSGGVTFSTGGAVRGRGTATSDEIDARLSNGEHVLTARDVDALGGQMGVYNLRRSLHQPSGSDLRSVSGRDMQAAYDPGRAQVRELAATMSGGTSTAAAERPINITGNHFTVNSDLDIRKVSEDLAKQVRRDMRAG